MLIICMLSSVIHSIFASHVILESLVIVYYSSMFAIIVYLYENKNEIKKSIIMEGSIVEN